MSTMKEKTDIISQLFDNYAQSVPPQVHLTKKAHDLVPSVHIKNRKRTVAFAFICCFLLCVTAGMITLLLPVVNQQNICIYNMTNISYRQINSSFAKDILNLSDLGNLDNNDGKTLVSEKYYAFSLKTTGKIVCVKAVLGISTSDGIVEITLFAEDNDYVNEELKTEYFEYISDTDKPVFIENLDYLDHGEYLASAFYKSDSTHYYAFTQSNPATRENVRSILNDLLMYGTM